MLRLHITLNGEGDGFSVLGEGDSPSFVGLTKEETKKIHPIIGQMASAQTRAEVTEALKAFKLQAKNQGVSNNYWKSDNWLIESDEGNISVRLLHSNTSYYGHAARPGNLHSDSVDRMIGFTDGSDRRPDSGCCCKIF
jgi:hypothetical protein